MAFRIGTSDNRQKDWMRTKTKIISFMVLAATMVIGVSSAAYAEGEDGITANGQEWQAANGNALVPATEWYAAGPARRVQLSHQFNGATVPAQADNGQSQTYSVVGK